MILFGSFDLITFVTQSIERLFIHLIPPPLSLSLFLSLSPLGRWKILLKDFQSPSPSAFSFSLSPFTIVFWLFPFFPLPFFIYLLNISLSLPCLLSLSFILFRLSLFFVIFLHPSLSPLLSFIAYLSLYFSLYNTFTSSL